MNQLTSAGGVSEPRFSPDGRWIGFLDRNRLWLLRTVGGSPHETAGLPGQVWHWAWSPTADLLAVVPLGENGGVWLVAPGRKATPVQGPPEHIEGFAWSPDGRQLAWAASLQGHSPITGTWDDALYVGTWRGNALTGIRQIYAASGAKILLAGWPSGGQLFQIDFQHPDAAEVASRGGLKDLDPQSGHISDLGVPFSTDWIVPAPPSGIYFVLGRGQGSMEGTLAKAEPATGQVTGVPLPAGSEYLFPTLAPGWDQLALLVGPSVPGGLDNLDEAGRRAWAKKISLAEANPDGTGFHVLTGAGQGVWFPVFFTGDGKHILYIRDNALWVIDTLGTKAMRLAGFGTSGNQSGLFAYHPSPGRRSTTPH